MRRGEVKKIDASLLFPQKLLSVYGDLYIFALGSFSFKVWNPFKLIFVSLASINRSFGKALMVSIEESLIVVESIHSFSSS